MAIEFEEGAYSLQQETSKKVILQLKLTDSALRAIEVYQDELGGSRLKPSIRFDGNQGVIQIPSNDVNAPQNFTFQLASLNQSSAIDCLQQYHTSDPLGHVAVLGGIQQKITVNAKDDSYNATKKRMEIVKEQEKNISTKVIKHPNSNKLGKKKVFRRQLLDHKQSHSSYSHGRTSTPPRSTFSRSVSPLTSSSLRSASPVSSGGDLAGVRNKTKPVLSSISSSTSSSSPSNSSVSRPLQERVTHYLAVRPTRLPDLAARLSRGTSPPDRTKLQGILQQIASSRVVRPGVSEYSLNKNLYNEINTDWPGYTDDERANVKRKHAEMVLRGGIKRPLPPSEDRLKNSPNSSMQNALEESYSNPAKKKSRISRVYTDKTSPRTRPRSVSPLESNGPMLSETPVPKSFLVSSSIVPLSDSDVNGLSMGQTNLSRRRSPKRPSSANSKSSYTPEKQLSPKKLPQFISESFTPPPPPSPSSSTVSSKLSNRTITDVSLSRSDSSVRPRAEERDYKRQRREESETSSSSKEGTKNARISHPPHDDMTLCLTFSHPPTEQDAFVKKYGRITKPEDRDRYKTDFYAEYKEYLSLFQKIFDKSKRFTDWKAELDHKDKNTDQYKSIARQVYEEYNRIKSDEVFLQDKKRLSYLHRKLKYIKDLVIDYDCKQMEQEVRDPEDRPNPHRRSNDVVQKRPLLTA